MKLRELFDKLPSAMLDEEVQIGLRNPEGYMYELTLAEVKIKDNGAPLLIINVEE